MDHVSVIMRCAVRGHTGRFKRIGAWNFMKWKMLLGSELMVFSNEQHPQATDSTDHRRSRGDARVAAPGFHAPAAPGFHAPAAPGFHASAAPGFHAPAAPGFHAPATPGFHAPATPGFHASAAPGFHALAKPARAMGRRRCSGARFARVL
jgi:hypothetical protein